MIVLVARYQVKPGHTETVLAALERMVAAIKADEPDCPLFQVCRSQSDPDHLLLYEHYIDAEALAAHRETAHFKAIVEAEIVPLLDRRERELYDLQIA